MGWLGGSLLFLVVMGPLLPRFKPATVRDLILVLFPRFAIRMTVFGGLTTLSGLGLLFAIVAGDTPQLALSSSWGRCITLGALLALVAAFEGAVVMPGYRARLAALTRAAPEGCTGPAPPEVTRVQRKVRIASVSNTILLLVARALMVAAAGALALDREGKRLLPRPIGPPVGGGAPLRGRRGRPRQG